jgi:hypothetical protein
MFWNFEKDDTAAREPIAAALTRGQKWTRAAGVDWSSGRRWARAGGGRWAWVSEGEAAHLRRVTAHRLARGGG